MSVLARSEPFAPGTSGVIFCLLPAQRRVVRVDMDPPTGAAFRIDCLDELSAGETHCLCGELVPALRIVVTHIGPVSARFRAAVVTTPELEGVERQIGRVVERDFGAAYDRARRENRGPDAPIVSLPNFERRATHAGDTPEAAQSPVTGPGARPGPVVL